MMMMMMMMMVDMKRMRVGQVVSQVADDGYGNEIACKMQGKCSEVWWIHAPSGLM